jgi:hypothetical protein
MKKVYLVLFLFFVAAAFAAQRVVVMEEFTRVGG